MSSNDPKYRFKHGSIINEQSNEPIPLDEPCMVFRARDVHAVEAIEAYLDSLRHHKVSDTHIKAVEARLEAFKTFGEKHPTRMKIPDTSATELKEEEAAL